MRNCILCGRRFRKWELPGISQPSQSIALYSLRRKILNRTDHPLKTCLVHIACAGKVLAFGNGWYRVPVYSPPSRPRKPKRTMGVLNGKLYQDDFQYIHSQHCRDPECPGAGPWLTPGMINRLMGITPAERQSISLETRQLILERYEYRCARCHKRRPLEMHHRRPVIHGGTNDPDNLVALCHPCHVQHSGEFEESIWPDLQSIFLNSES
jgi:HNH endonuclease